MPTNEYSDDSNDLEMPPGSDGHHHSERPADVVGGLQTILNEYDEDVQRLFGVALSIFAGPNAISQTESEKSALLESKIRTP